MVFAPDLAFYSCQAIVVTLELLSNQSGQLSLLPSIHALTPLEEGGAIARTGFLYQDHVAAGFCIQMLADPSLSEVWCETEDDVTLLWALSTSTLVEYVQIKSDSPTQLWSIALLCSGGAVSSIVAKSLKHDRCSEDCCFRVLTRTDINHQLRPLLLPRDHADRGLGNLAMREIHQKVCEALGNTQSEKGRSASHWVADTIWEVGESERSIINANNLELERYLEKEGEPLFSDQRQELYDHILLRVQRASFPKWTNGGAAKKISSAAFRKWLLEEVNRLKGNSSAKGGENLARKMADANLPAATIENANRLRIGYRLHTLSPKYQQDGGLRSAELEVTAVMQELLSNLDAGNISETGAKFHARCLTALNEIKSAFPAADLSFLQGALYTATDRCRHRFLSAGT